MTSAQPAPIARDPGLSVQPIEQLASEPSTTYLARLAVLRDEAAETVRLAGLWRRTPYMGIPLALGAAATAAVSAPAFAAGLAAWLVLVIGGLVAVGAAHSKARRVPFELDALRGFAHDLRADMLYLGFAWGAGAFLAIPATAGLSATILFALGTGLLVAIVLGDPEGALRFVLPLVFVCAGAALARGLPGAGLATGAILLGGALILMTALGAARLAQRRWTTLPAYFPAV